LSVNTQEEEYGPMKPLDSAWKVGIGLVAAACVVMATRPADAGLFRRQPIVVVTPAPVMVAPVTTAYAAPVTTVTETRAVYSAPVVVAAPVATSYTTTTVVEEPVRASYLVPTAVTATPVVVRPARPVRVVVPRQVYRIVD
jgi:hypothetical protein